MARRYFVDPLPPPGPAVLRGEVARHLATVLRIRPGETLVLGDGRGRQSEAVVRRADARTVEVTLAAPTVAPPPALGVHLAFAAPRAARAEWLFEHGTEVGVAVFWPLATERARPGAERAERWQRLVRAAAGQCDRAWLPEIRPARPLAAFLADASLPARRLLAAPGAPPPAPGPAGAVVLLVGPEGGFAPAEAAAARAAGFVPVGLGPYVLRTETAALVGAAALWLLEFTRTSGSPPPRS